MNSLRLFFFELTEENNWIPVVPLFFPFSKILCTSPEEKTCWAAISYIVFRFLTTVDSELSFHRLFRLCFAAMITKSQMSPFNYAIFIQLNILFSKRCSKKHYRIFSAVSFADILSSSNKISVRV